MSQARRAGDQLECFAICFRTEPEAHAAWRMLHALTAELDWTGHVNAVVMPPHGEATLLGSDCWTLGIIARQRVCDDLERHFLDDTFARWPDAEMPSPLPPEFMLALQRTLTRTA